MLFRQLLPLHQAQARTQNSHAGLIMCAGTRSARRSRARVSESTRSVFTLAALIALSLRAWASVSEMSCSAHRSATQYQLPVDSTTARCGPGRAERSAAHRTPGTNTLLSDLDARGINRGNHQVPLVQINPVRQRPRKGCVSNPCRECKGLLEVSSGCNGRTRVHTFALRSDLCAAGSPLILFVL